MCFHVLTASPPWQRNPQTMPLSGFVCFLFSRFDLNGVSSKSSSRSSFFEQASVWAPSLMVQYFLWNDWRLSFLVKYRIRRVFIETWQHTSRSSVFLEGISSPLAVKKGEAEAGALYVSRCDVLYKTFRCLNRKKRWHRSHCLILGKT